MASSQPSPKLLQLPTEILSGIVQYLEPPDYLTFCSSSRYLSVLRQDPYYWRRVTQSTYRLPNQPLQQTDGARWMHLYRQLRVESRAYTWGSNSIPRALGHAPRLLDDPNTTHNRYSSPACVGWPTEMYGLEQLDPIVDIQCGGWNTTVLTSKGDLYSVGALAGHVQEVTYRMLSHLELQILVFSDQNSRGHQRPADTMIAQFSVGRRDILAISDSGLLWQWSMNIAGAAAEVRFKHTEVPEVPPGGKAIASVVAGWSVNSAYIRGKGIVYWKVVDRLLPRSNPAEAASPVTVAVDDSLVPRTSYRRPRGRGRDASGEEQELGATVGEVVGHVVLEGYIVFLTDLGKVFAIRHGAPADFGPGIFELAHFEPTQSNDKMSEIQGAFRSFAVFNTGGDVVIGDQDLLERAWANAFEQPAQANSLLPLRPPELQRRGIVSLAFGDWHRLALTKDGHILASGREPRACGCLGLGTRQAEGPLRGVVYTDDQWHSEGDLGDQWRRVWFSPEQREWMRYMRRGGFDSNEGIQRVHQVLRHEPAQREIADWFEEHGSDWDLHPALDDERQPWSRGEPAYRAVKISAAGWRSAALVLGDQGKIDRMYRAHAGFLPEPDAFRYPASTRALSQLVNRVLTFGAPAPPAEVTQRCVLDEQRQGKDHEYYHSKLSWDPDRQDVHEAARHEVWFPSAPE